MEEEDIFFFDHHGNPNLQMTCFLHVLYMSEPVFKSLNERKRGWIKYFEQISSTGWNVKKGDVYGTFSLIHKKIANTLFQCIQSRLTTYPTPLEEDEIQLKGIMNSDCPLKWALILRITEKRILKRANEQLVLIK